MAASSDILAIAIIEKDAGGPTVTWQFPELDHETEELVLARTQAAAKYTGTWFSKHHDVWHYVVGTDLPVDQTILPKVSACCIVLLSKSYEPGKFFDLGRLMLQLYIETGEPTQLLQGYLSVFTEKRWASPHGAWAESSYNPRDALVEGHLAQVITLFGQQTVLLWMAVLLKKRILVYSDTIDTLLPVVQTLPQFVFHRMNVSILRPIITATPSQTSDLRDSGVFCAGVLSTELRSSTDLYDLFVDVPARTITPADHCKEVFAIDGLQRDVAAFLVKTGAETDPVAVIKGVSSKTKEILNRVKSFAGESGKVTGADLESKGLPAPTVRFLHSMALAEGFGQ